MQKMSLILHKRKRKGFLSAQQLVVIVLVIVSFLLTWQVISHAMTKIEEKSIEEICRGSIAVREQSKFERPIIGGEQQVIPLLCRTSDKVIPYSSENSREDIKKSVADLVVRCWWMFGEGRVNDLFDNTIGGTNSCFVCYNIKTKSTSKFKEPIPAREMFEYMMKTPYQVKRDDDNCKDFGGNCVAIASECNLQEGWKLDPDNKQCLSQDVNEKICCYSKFSCLNKGGQCFSDEADRAKEGLIKYPEWNCPPDRKYCYIKDDNFYSYIDYIQSWGGQGISVITTDIAPNANYAITYGEDNRKCGEICTWVAGGTAVVGGGILLVASGGTAAIVGAAAGGILAYVGTQKTVDLINIYTERKLNTVYLTTMDQVTQSEVGCNIDYGIGGE